MSQGWIKIHRQIQDCEIWDNGEPFDISHAWIDLLLLVNHKDKNTIFNNKVITVKRGQRITSIRKLADRWHWSFDRTRRYLIMLEELGMIIRESDNRRSLLTIVNYGVYQDESITEQSQTSAQNDHRQVHRQVTNKNDKERKNEKNIKISFGEYQNVKLTSDEYERLEKEYGLEKLKQAIKYFDEYIEDKGYKSKSHNLAMRRWVFKALDEKKPKNSFMKKEVSHEEIESLYAN